MGASCLTASGEAEFARDVEQWGYSALWTPEAMGRDVLVNSAGCSRTPVSWSLPPGLQTSLHATQWPCLRHAYSSTSNRAEDFCSAWAFRTHRSSARRAVTPMKNR